MTHTLSNKYVQPFRFNFLVFVRVVGSIQVLIMKPLDNTEGRLIQSLTPFPKPYSLPNRRVIIPNNSNLFCLQKVTIVETQWF